jgi:very-short-patch-repair endonuclease
MSSKLKAIAKEQRDNPTDAESKLWEQLRRGQIDGHKFRRKHVFRSFIVDFACLERRVVIEIETDDKDRESSEEKKKDQWLKNRDYIVLYFKELEVVRDSRGVIPTIERGLKGLPPVEKDVVSKKKATIETNETTAGSEEIKAAPKASKSKDQKVVNVVAEKKATPKKAAPKKAEKVKEPKTAAKKEEKVLKPKANAKTKPESSLKEPQVKKPVISKKEEPKVPIEPVKKVESLKDSASEPAQKAEKVEAAQAVTIPKTKIEPEPVKENESVPVVTGANSQTTNATETEKLLEKIQANDSLSGLTVGDVDFSNIEFMDNANFSGVIFSGVTNFSGARFKNGADFSDAQFTGSSGPDFSKVTFVVGGKVDFVDTFFSKDSLADFSSIKAETPQNIQFENVFLGRASFLNTDVSQFQFKNIQLCQLPLKDEDWFDFFSFLKRNIIGIKTWSEFKVQVKNFLPIALSPEPVKRIGLVDEVWNEVANNGQTRLMDSEYYRQVSELYKQFWKNFQRNKVYSLTVDLRYGEYETSQK